VTNDLPERPSHLLPIAETVEAIEEYGPFSLDRDLLEDLRAQGERVRAIAPGCVGMSVASFQHGVTFTLVASDDGTAVLDGGPAAEAAPVLEEGDLLSEERWRILATTVAARGVASSLSLPITEGSLVVGSINLYGAEPATFHGHVDALAQTLGAWAAGAITNADLAFDSLERARSAPALLREETTVSVAAGVLAVAFSCSVASAEGRLRRGALRTGVPVGLLAAAITDAYRGS